MKKILLPLILLLLLLQACGEKVQHITFTATVESDGVTPLLVSTDDDVGFDLASVTYDKGYTPSFEPRLGQRVFITILPEIRESYPVQVTAVKLEPAVVQYQKITPEEAKTLMDEGGVVVLDVRTLQEFEAGHIDGAVLLPDYEIEEKAGNTLPDRDAVILVYCRSGNRSESASRKLIDMGYTDVRDFGGIIDWPYEYQ